VSDVDDQRLNKSLEYKATAPKDFEQIAHELCENALNDAKAHLHPLLRNIELNRLEKRSEFLQVFRLTLEHRVARQLAAWQRGGIQAVFRFDETRRRPGSLWDGSIHLLAKVSRLSNSIKTLSRKLDQSLLKRLQELGWSCFQQRRSILEIQQVTPREIRRGISYGAMFYAVYTVPVRIWPQKRPAG
jgi:hypothetical protein